MTQTQPSMDAGGSPARAGWESAAAGVETGSDGLDPRPGGKPYLEVDGISISFPSAGGDGTISVLEDMSFSLERGEFCCIVGPSGCGKSTSLRIIDGLESAGAGQVRVDGEIVTAPRPDISFVFQQFNLLPWRTLLGNVSFGLDNLKMPRAEREERARHFLSLVGLTDFADYYPSQISGGMQQRVGLARALAVDPKLLLMDEPFGAVDAQTRMLLQSELLRLWEAEQKTVVFVTHDIEEALYLGNRVLILGPRPSRVLRDIKVPFGHPRDDSIRGTPEFAALKDEIWRELKDAMTQAPDEEHR